jgi:phosphatidylglycerophosphate synthase
LTPSDLRAWVAVDPAAPPARIYGLTAAERLTRALSGCGLRREHVTAGSTPPALDRVQHLVLVDASYVIDDRLVQAIVDSANTALVVDRGGRPDCVAVHADGNHVDTAVGAIGMRESDPSELTGAGFLVRKPEELVALYSSKLRSKSSAFVLPVDPGSIGAIERRLFDASYKGVTDLVTKWVWPMPARWVTTVLARHGVKPNTVTAWSWVLAALAGVLFARGSFGLGLLVSWVMTFLDTVDGKLARVTLSSSKVGDVFDHSLDLLHPPLWYLAWGMGLGLDPAWQDPAVAVTVWGYVVGRLIEGLFLLVCKTEIHNWRPIDSWFRTVTARRNPNLILLTAGLLAGRPDLGIVLVAIWTAISVGFHTVRLVQASLARVRGDAVEPWMSAVSSVQR